MDEGAQDWSKEWRTAWLGAVWDELVALVVEDKAKLEVPQPQAGTQAQKLRDQRFLRSEFGMGTAEGKANQTLRGTEADSPPMGVESKDWRDEKWLTSGN